MPALTKQTKERMVRSILGDIPVVDFQTQGADFIVAAVVAKSPAKIQEMWKDKALRPYLHRARISSGCGAICGLAPWPEGYARSREVEALVGAETWSTFLDFCRQNTAQKEARKALSRELEASFEGVRTYKQFRERFPDLVKYLPEETGSTANLPATTHLVESLKAAGLVLETVSA